ncbi:MAG: hypothetical protein L6R41_001814 [Letrouitia leprolyta]|nr:MAG: hypothetical protein L6R41_001814 [Letrouitia leprolyta]
MVFKPFTHLARQSLGKTFTHGYAQSVVAATQSSYASSTTPFGPFSSHAASKFGKHGSSQLHSSFQPPSTPSCKTANGGQQTHATQDPREDGGLAAYYEAWQKQQGKIGGGQEWKQFQFPLRIGWKAPNVLSDGKSVVKRGDTRLRPDTLLEHNGLDRAYSSSAVDDIKKAEDVVAEAAAVEQIDKAIAQEINSLQTASAHSPMALTTDGQESADTASILGLDATQSIHTASPIQSSLSLTDTTVPTPESLALSSSVVQLREFGRYNEIPAAFELLLAKELQPSVEAYNALLAAAINLPAAKHLVVSQALNVYASMLRRQVAPDTAFYTTLLELLSQQAIDIHRAKHTMNIKQLRYFNPRLGESKDSFQLQSDQSEWAILLQDDTLNTAINIFNAAVTTSEAGPFSSDVYSSLVTACALYGRIDDMLQVHAHLEQNKVLPRASMFPPMIEAFARRGDLRSAVECYDGYKDLATQNDLGCNTLVGRIDNEVYAAVVKSYAMCGRTEAGNRFLSRIIESFDGNIKDVGVRSEAIRDIIITRGLIQHQIDAAQYAVALETAATRNLSSSARSNALAHICSAAADHNDKKTAVEAYQGIDKTASAMSMAALSLLAMHIRCNQLDDARTFWSVLYGSLNTEISLVEPTIMYAIALINRGQIDEALQHAREAFTRMRAAVDTTDARIQIKEKIDEAIEHVGNFLIMNGVVISPQARMILLWVMSENNGPVSPVSEHLLAGLGPETFPVLSWQDIALLLRTEAAIISGGAILQDVAHVARFEYLMDIVTRQGALMDETTVKLVEKTLKLLQARYPDLSIKWQKARHMITQRARIPTLHSAAPSVTTNTPGLYPDAYDPYEASVDHRGSNVIMSILENPRPRYGAKLDEALSRLQTMRHAGQHPHYKIYSNLIASAAKEGRASAIFEILKIAQQDIPLLPQYSPVRDGWSLILDSMVAACLTVGDRTAASEYHQELLQIGSAPTANTFGLYITTLRDSARTLDEANEALTIFCSAEEQGVEPTSFLYNALIGKLAKARRMDHCYFYFSQMRRLGIQPTSITYGTMINAMCRVSNEREAEQVFNEMEGMPNYKPRPAPYNTMMQYFLGTKHDSMKVSEYYSRMLSQGIRPTMHTFKLLIDTHATLEPINMAAAEGVLDEIRASGARPEAIHYAALVHAKGCTLRDMASSRATFDAAIADPEVGPHACLYQALFESMVTNRRVEETNELLEDMASRGVEMTAYIANTLIQGWTTECDLAKAQAIYESVGMEKREPSTYDAMTRGFLAFNERQQALDVVNEMLSKGYPQPVTNRITALLGSNGSRAASTTPMAPVS